MALVAGWWAELRTEKYREASVWLGRHRLLSQQLRDQLSVGFAQGGDRADEQAELNRVEAELDLVKDELERVYDEMDRLIGWRDDSDNDAT